MDNRKDTAFETPFFTIEQLNYEDRGQPYYRLSGADSAIVLVFNERTEILLVTQFRPALGEVTFEVPAGAIEPGEIPIAAARREVLEETGYGSRLFSLGDYFHLMMNRTNIRDHLFCGLVEPGQPSQPEEGIRHHWVSRKRFLELALNGGFRQLAGLGAVPLANKILGLDVMSASSRSLTKSLKQKLAEA